MTTLPFILRDYRAGDASAMARVYFLAVRDLGPRRYTRAQVAAWAPEEPDPERFVVRAGDGRRTLVAVDTDGCVLGFGDLEANGHIDLLYCHPDAVGTGVASRIVEALLDHARTAGITDLHVEASELARSLFERHDFTLVQRRDVALNGVPIHNYLMTRLLR
ncbi:GNAT family N-acetyltransferase [Sphingomonas sp. Mn802worker]|uniref:GNAT family N-acetyltransferase n=1 Tax=Sphingomonas sp. Mn802worker TaxID=629773 RepID=UPI000478381D|nr:GNAT family N-acetyltransferase [Sphingomonas sp. Mn802worker]